MSIARRQARGITLIELVMTLAIVAILAAAAAPAFGSLVQSSEARAAKSGLTVALNTARMGAVGKSADVVACPSRDGEYCDHSTEWQRGWLVFVDADASGARSEDEAIVTLSEAQPEGIAIVSSAGRQRVVYRPDGSSAGSNLTLTVCDRRGAEAATALVVNNAGRVRSGVPTPAAAAACVAAIGRGA